MKRNIQEMELQHPTLQNKYRLKSKTWLVFHHGKDKNVELSKVYNKLIKIINSWVYNCNELSILTNLFKNCSSNRWFRKKVFLTLKLQPVLVQKFINKRNYVKIMKRNIQEMELHHPKLQIKFQKYRLKSKSS